MLFLAVLFRLDPMMPGTKITGMTWSGGMMHLARTVFSVRLMMDLQYGRPLSS